MTDEEKLYQAYYQADRLWTGNKAIKELHKITSMLKKDIFFFYWIDRYTLVQTNFNSNKTEIEIIQSQTKTRPNYLTMSM